MEKRQISNRKNKICLFSGLCMIVISSVAILLTVLCERRKWLSQNLDLIYLLIGIIGLLLMFIGIVNIVSNIEINKCLKNPAYGLDYEKELSTYKIIGKDTKKAKNCAIEFRKYSEWKGYIENTFAVIKDDEDAYRFMIRRLRNKDSYKELIVSAVIPIEVGIFTVFYSTGNGLSELGTILCILVSAIILIVIVTVNYIECKEEIGFISDFNEIIFPSKLH